MKKESKVARHWSWLLIPVLGIILLIAVAIPTESPSPEASTPSPASLQEGIREEAAMMRDWAKKSGGDFSKLPPEVQSYINRVSMGHGREWLRMEAERQKKEEHKRAK